MMTEEEMAQDVTRRPTTQVDTDEEDAADTAPERQIEVVPGEKIDADEDLLDDYELDTDEITCLHSRVRNIPALRLERFSKLEKLCLRQNAISKIEGLPTTLLELDLYDNSIGHMDGLSAQTKLQMLDLSFNRIKHIKQLDPLGSSLKLLYLVQNKISRIEHLESLVNLTMLELGANKIREIEGLQQLKMLEELWLGKNKITSLAGGCLAGLPKLRLLSIQSNRLTSLDGIEEVAETLEELYVAQNGLLNLRPLSTLKKLQVLDISGNRIEHLTDLAHLTDLRELWASTNQLSSFDEIERECKALPNLETVYFEGNPLQRQNPTTYRNKIKLSVGPQIKQIDANILRA
jgi:protein phosphatase 1 regulatory subunit 7